MKAFCLLYQRNSPLLNSDHHDGNRVYRYTLAG